MKVLGKLRDGKTMPFTFDYKHNKKLKKTWNMPEMALDN